MNHNIEEWLMAALCCDAAPEFRARNLFDEAYSGPEQRRRENYRLNKNPRPRILVADTKLPDIAVAA